MTRTCVDTSGLDVRLIPAALATEMVVANHYLHRRPSISTAVGLFRGDRPVGAVTFGCPASRHMQMGACPKRPELVTELNRLWVADDQAAGTESWFVSRALRLLAPRIVVSYADTSRGHVGYIYRALNFRYAGWTDMERRQPRLDYIPAKGEQVHTREAYRSGVARKVRRAPKVKYWITTGNRAERKGLERMCGWPSISWREFPPPEDGHRQLILTAPARGSS